VDYPYGFTWMMRQEQYDSPNSMGDGLLEENRTSTEAWGGCIGKSPRMHLPCLFHNSQSTRGNSMGGGK